VTTGAFDDNAVLGGSKGDLNYRQLPLLATGGQTDAVQTRAPFVLAVALGVAAVAMTVVMSTVEDPYRAAWQPYGLALAGLTALVAGWALAQLRRPHAATAVAIVPAEAGTTEPAADAEASVPPAPPALLRRRPRLVAATSALLAALVTGGFQLAPRSAALPSQSNGILGMGQSGSGVMGSESPAASPSVGPSSPGAATATPASGGEQAGGPTGPVRIAFSTTRDHQSDDLKGDAQRELYTMNIDGTAQTRWTNNTCSDSMPTWSPARTDIVFSSDCDDSFSVADTGVGLQLWRLDVRTGRVSRVTHDPDHQYVYPVYSPDGRSIAFMRASHQPNTPYEVGIIRADGSGLRTVPAGTGTDWPPPVWSPVGTRLAFDVLGASTPTVVVSVSDLTTRQPMMPSFNGFLQDWSANGYLYKVGSDIAYLRNDQTLVWLSGPNSGTAAANSVCTAQLSPDGLSATYDANDQIYVVRVDGTSRRVVTSSAGANSCLGW
jgi:Tol biopolymer transport system component